MRETDKIAEALFEKIRDRFEDVSLGDDKAKATQDPENARFFNFDYVVDDKNYGNITISLIDESSLKVYFSKNISHELQDEERDKWYAFLRELREFSKRNLLSFEPRDITRATLKHRDLQQVSKADSTYDKDEVVSESRMYGTMNRSYEDFGPVRIKVAHAKPITDETRGARSRNIAALFVENNQGERFRMPFESLIGTRAMARHISAGGTPSDEFGQHICEMVEELNKLRPFVHSMRHRQFEDATTNDMLESAFEYHGLLKNTLKKLKGKKGYNEYKESYTPPLNETDEFNEDELREKFVKKVFPDRLSQALPIVHKAYNMKKENANQYSAQFENWANGVAESWDDSNDAGNEPISVDDLADLLAEPVPFGVDGINAVAAIRDAINSNELESKLVAQAKQNPDADARDSIVSWVYDNAPTVYQELMNEIGDVDSGELGESGTGDAPVDSMTRAELLDFLGASPEEVMNVSDDELRVAANEKAESLPEGDTYGASGTDEPVVDEAHDDYAGEDQIESIQSAILRRILGNIGQHQELLMKAGPDGVMNAARDVASFHAPVEELGSSDISIMVREVYREVGVEYSELPEQLEKHLSEEYCDACDSAKCCCDNGNEEMDESVAGDDHVNKDEKLKRMGAKPLSFKDKLKTIPQGIKAMAKGEPEDDVTLYNKQFDEDIAQMRKIAGLVK